MDFSGPMRRNRGGFKHIYLMVDTLTRRVRTKVRRKTYAHACIGMLEEWIRIMDKRKHYWLLQHPSFSHSCQFAKFCTDRGIQFESCTKLGARIREDRESQCHHGMYRLEKTKNNPQQGPYVMGDALGQSNGTSRGRQEVQYVWKRTENVLYA